ncbi:MAG: DsbA family protein [Candidatus Zambryskibacteria bacterium]|nr:DsbA family protein [Candidatus Zambryskibacteria bacterium]
MEPQQNTEQLEQPSKFMIPLAIVVAGAMVAGAIYFGGSVPSRSLTGETSSEVDIPKVTENDHYIGQRNAKIIIIEYSDIECPFCKIFHYTMKEILNTYPNDVAWVYRHYPIPQLHAKAIKEAEATECAAELGGNQAFWNYLDEIFATTNSNDSLDLAELPRIAGTIGLDVTAFNECLDSGRHTETVTKDIVRLQKQKLGTPYSVITLNGEKKYVINGAEPIASIKLKIDSLLK